MPGIMLGTKERRPTRTKGSQSSEKPTDKRAYNLCVFLLSLKLGFSYTFYLVFEVFWCVLPSTRL